MGDLTEIPMSEKLAIELGDSMRVRANCKMDAGVAGRVDVSVVASGTAWTVAQLGIMLATE